MKVIPVLRHLALAATATSLLNGCAAIDRIATVGRPPPLVSIDNPTAHPGYQPVALPMPSAMPASYNPNSLWRNGSRAFFKDQRAHQIGDILTVKINITDKAIIDNETKKSRSTTQDSGISNLFGKGTVNRSEALQTNVAAVVTQLVPNGNLVIQGKQEIRVNFEIREMIVGG